MHRYFLIDYYLGELTEKQFTTVDERKMFLQLAQVQLHPEQSTHVRNIINPSWNV
jgi:hypothetical protein